MTRAVDLPKSLPAEGRPADGACVLPPGSSLEARRERLRIMFVSEHGQPHPVAAALCASCPVNAACHAYATKHHPDGTWAGYTWRQRERLRRGRPANLIGRPRAEPHTAPEHGTRASYSRGCRCVPCRQANAAYGRQHRTGAA